MLMRAVDLLVSAIALVLLGPVLLLIALAVKLDSPGPVFYAQVRVGRGGRPFRLFKFRSMVVRADRLGPPLTGRRDPRITRVGAVLRQTRLDELPQLLNVLRGEMALVGPRPEVPAIVERYSDEQRAVLDVRPGITGPTQLLWLGESEQYPEGADPVEYYVRHFLKAKLDTDLEYVRTRSLVGDLKWLVRTPLVLARAAVEQFRLTAAWHRLGRLAVDVAAVAVAHLAAFWARFEWPIPGPEVAYLLWGLPLTCGVYLGASLLLRTDRSIWRFASVADVWLVVRAVALGASLQAVALVLLGWRPYPRSVVVFTAVLSVVLMSAARLLARSVVEAPSRGRPPSSRRRVLIVGAGRTGEAIAREIREGGGEYEMVGFVDDDPAKLGQTIHRCPVLGTTEELPALVQARDVQEVIVAIPGLTGRQLRRIAERCLAAGVPFKSLPSLGQLVRGEGKLRYLRKVDVDDLLPHPPLRIDEAAIRALLTGKRVMVTGAGGSIGSELCRQVLRLGAGALVMVERAENALHDISLEIRSEFPGVPVEAALADVKHVPRMAEIFRRCRPDTVFHAAAYKHVPILENHPGEAVLNNVVGTKRLAEVARRFGTETFVFISTDKAVDPKNLLGVTKRIGEMYIGALNAAMSRATGARTRYLMVRFGNVLGSAGSVLPLFQRQIESGSAVTITDPEVSRFFMTIPEAVGLVLQSVAMPGDGDLFVLDMGDPVKIRELADGLVTSLGLSPVDVERQYVGLRPGEKLTEALWEPEEEVSRTAHPRIFVARQPARRLEEMEALIANLEALAIQGDIHGLLARLGEVFPGYRHERPTAPFAVADPGERQRVLVVDDDRAVCAVIRDVLEDGFEVSEAHSAREALARIRAERPHLVLLDLVLPDASGLDVCRSLRCDPMHDAIPIIFMTGYGDPATAVAALESGGDDYLTKPCPIEELRARVEAVLRRTSGAPTAWSPSAVAGRRGAEQAKRDR